MINIIGTVQILTATSATKVSIRTQYSADRSLLVLSGR